MQKKVVAVNDLGLGLCLARSDYKPMRLGCPWLAK